MAFVLDTFDWKEFILEGVLLEGFMAEAFLTSKLLAKEILVTFDGNFEI